LCGNQYFLLTSETEELKIFEKIPLKNLHCLSGGKDFLKRIIFSSRPSFGDFRKFFKNLAEFSGLEFFSSFASRQKNKKSKITNEC
jgi:hypothetical protein